MSDFIELKEYPGYFIAHSPARLRRIVGNKMYDCKQTPNSKQDNYWTVTVKNKMGKYVKRSMHRLLMETFVPNPLKKAHVNHIDGNKSNNAITNLEWATPKENSQHAIRIGLKSADYKIKPVYQYSLAGKFIAEYPDDSTAQALTGIPKQNISKATLGQRIHAGFFQWKRKKQTEILPIKRRYIKGYQYQGEFYNSLKDLAIILRYQNPQKMSLNRLKEEVRNQVEIIYHE